MFIDSQGNVCPCDFTMLSFGNILERPIQEIWEETRKDCLSFIKEWGFRFLKAEEDKRVAY